MTYRPEQQLQILVADYLRVRYPQLLWFHPNNNIPMKGKQRLGGIMKRMGVRAGVADIIMFWKDRSDPIFSSWPHFGAIELKSAKGTQQSTQKLFQSQWQHAGGQYAICRDLDQVIAVLKTWGVQ